MFQKGKERLVTCDLWFVHFCAVWWSFWFTNRNSG